MLEVKMEEKDNGWETRTHMTITHKGKVIREESDGGEPEDNSFGRDWGWVPGAIEGAYKLGVQDGKDGHKTNG